MNIISNGSKWCGQPVDGVPELLEALRKYTLDPKFEDYGNFYYEPEYLDASKQPPPGTFCVFGNFYDASHVFQIEGTAEELEPIRLAIEANKAMPAYQKAKDEMAERERARLRESARRRLDEEQLKIANARAVLGL